MTVLLQFEVDDVNYPYIASMASSNEENFAEHIRGALDRYWAQENKGIEDKYKVNSREQCQVHVTTKEKIVHEYLSQSADMYEM